MSKIRRDSWSYDYTKDTMGEDNALPSLTVPDQTLTMRQILDRYTRGLPVDAAVHIPSEEDVEDELMPDVEHMDLADLQELQRMTNERLAELKAKAVAEKKAKLEAKKAASTPPAAAPSGQHVAQSGEAGNYPKNAQPAGGDHTRLVPGKGLMSDDDVQQRMF